MFRVRIGPASPEWGHSPSALAKADQRFGAIGFNAAIFTVHRAQLLANDRQPAFPMLCLEGCILGILCGKQIYRVKNDLYIIRGIHGLQ